MSAQSLDSRPTGVSLVIPAHNEQACVAEAVDRAYAVLSARDEPFEVIVVDDGCTDATPHILDCLSTEHEWLRVAHLPTRRGKGFALRAGFACARFSEIAFVDADLQVPMEALAPLLAEADAATVVVGRKVGAGVPATRLLVSRIYGLLARVLLGVQARDVGCPLKAFPRSLVEGVAFASDGWVIDAELLGLARIRGYHMAEVDAPVGDRSGGQSNVSMRQVLGCTNELVRVWRAQRRLRRRPEVSAATSGRSRSEPS